jgi:hypothetical protein
MKIPATRKLHSLGQSLWLDNITRDLLNTGTLKRYIDELSVTGLTSNPTIFDQAIKNSATYDKPIRAMLRTGKQDEALFFERRWKTLPGRPICSGRFMSGPTALMDGCPWKFRRCSPMTRTARWPL